MSNIDAAAVISFILFALALLMGLYDVADAWRNLVAGLEYGDGSITAIGIDDFLRAFAKTVFIAAPGVLVTGLALAVAVPPRTDVTPTQITLGLVLRATMISIALGAMLSNLSSLWLRRYLAYKRGWRQRTIKTGAVNVQADEATVLLNKEQPK